MTDGPGGPAEADARIEVGQATHVGMVRTGNEDTVLCEPVDSALSAAQGVFCAVADGMGGHAAGEEASDLAVKVARERFYATTGLDPKMALKLAVEEANAEVFDAGAGATGRDHMGSTLTAAVLIGTRVVVGHVGDSRAYLVRDDLISQITHDHSWVAEEVAQGRMTPEQARVSPRRNIITRALGLRPDVEVDAYEVELEEGDIVVICSDGLHGLVSDKEISNFVRQYRPGDAVNALINLANNRGGPDNISVVVARVRGSEADEADTARGGYPVLDEAYEEMIATSRVSLSDLRSEMAGMSAATDEQLTEPPLVLDPPPPAPAPPAPDPSQSLVVSAARQPARAPAVQRGSRRSGLAFLVVILLLLALGTAVAVVAFMFLIR